MCQPHSTKDRIKEEFFWRPILSSTKCHNQIKSGAFHFFLFLFHCNPFSMHFFNTIHYYPFTINYRHATFLRCSTLISNPNSFLLSSHFFRFDSFFHSFVRLLCCMQCCDGSKKREKNTNRTIKNRIRIHIVTNYLRSTVTGREKKAGVNEKGWKWTIGKIHFESFAANLWSIRHTDRMHSEQFGKCTACTVRCTLDVENNRHCRWEKEREGEIPLKPQFNGRFDISTEFPKTLHFSMRISQSMEKSETNEHVSESEFIKMFDTFLLKCIYHQLNRKLH